MNFTRKTERASQQQTVAMRGCGLEILAMWVDSKRWSQRLPRFGIGSKLISVSIAEGAGTRSFARHEPCGSRA